MNTRRGFLTAITAAVAIELDLDRLLWVPGTKKIFIPPKLWVPDCWQCKHNIRTKLARELTRVTEVHGLKYQIGHLFTKDEFETYNPDIIIAQGAYNRIIKDYYAS